MGIQTDRPGGGDDTMVVHRAKSADDARKARAALQGAGIPVDLPDQAIDAWFATKTEELHIKVALKHWSKGAKAIEEVIPRETEAPVIHEADDRQAAAEAVLQHVEAPAPVDTSKEPASAVDKSAQRAFYVACASIFAPPIGIIAAVWGASVWAEMRARPEDYFRRRLQAQIATFMGALVGIVGGLIIYAKMRAR